MTTLVCHPPHSAWDRLRAALIGAFASVNAESISPAVFISWCAVRVCAMWSIGRL